MENRVFGLMQEEEISFQLISVFWLNIMWSSEDTS